MGFGGGREQVSDQGKTVLSQRQQKLVRGLHRRRIREVEACFLAEGVRVVEDLLASSLRLRFLVHVSSLADTERGAGLLATAERRGVERHAVPEAELARLAATDAPQGVVAVAEIPQHTLDDIRLLPEPATVLVLDAVQDPGNLGTLTRTAEALGAAGVVTLPGTVDPWNPKSVRAAAGSLFRVPVLASDWPVLQPWLRRERIRSYAAVVGGAPLDDDRPRRAALVVGNEGAGVSADTLRHSDLAIGIPLRGRAESLNVAAAAAILLFQLQR